jgi:hypothetical protein
LGRESLVKVLEPLVGYELRLSTDQLVVYVTHDGQPEVPFRTLNPFRQDVPCNGLDDILRQPPHPRLFASPIHRCVIRRRRCGVLLISSDCLEGDEFHGFQQLRCDVPKCGMSMLVTYVGFVFQTFLALC